MNKDKQNNCKPKKELIDAIKEGNDIIKGKKRIKVYNDVNEMVKDILKK